MNVGERPRQLTVKIEEKHIREGIARHSNRCVIADAIKEQHPDFSHVSVDLATIRASDKKRGVRAMWFTPPALQKIILAVDQGKRELIKPLHARLTAGQIVPIRKLTRAQSKRKAAGYRVRKAASKKKMLKQTGGSGRAPIVQGGRLPPIATGSKRQFGIRGMSV